MSDELIKNDTHPCPSPVLARGITGIFGAYISGIDIRERQDKASVSAIKAALDQYKVLVFRDQNGVTPRQLLAFAENFGAPETTPHPSHPDHEDAVGVKVLVSDAAHLDSRFVDTWHTDGATRQNTHYISLLQAIDVPDSGRDTMFADMVTAYERLSTPMKAFLDPLIAEHSWGDQKPGEPSVYHPLILTDARTGMKSLYANRMYTRSIKGLRDDESAMLLEFLCGQARIPELQLRVSWEPGSIVMWNNELVQHYLVMDKAYARVMHRVMVS